MLLKQSFCLCLSLAAHDTGAGNIGHCQADGSKSDTALAAGMRRSSNSDVNIRINLTYDTAQLRDEKKHPEEQTSVAVLSAQNVELRSKLEQVQTQNDELLSQVQQKEREIARLTNAARDAEPSVTAAGTQTEDVVITSVEAGCEEVAEVKCQLTELQRCSDQLVLETESLRAKLRYATTHHGISKLSYCRFKPANYSYKYRKYKITSVLESQ